MQEIRGLDARHCQDRLRTQLFAAERGAYAPLDCRAVWSELVTGTTMVVGGFFSEERCYLVLATRHLPPQRSPRARDLRILEQVAGGSPQKVVSSDLGLSVSSVGCIVKQCLQFFGICCCPSQIPIPLVMMVNASLSGRPLRGARIEEFECDGMRYRAVSAPRPERTVASLLSPAQYDAVRLLLEGGGHMQIALTRNTSKRTVANQLCAAFHRLGVSGRAELVHALALLSQECGRLPSRYNRGVRWSRAESIEILG